jgi:uncharacterized protein (UPF0333 family)
VAELIEYALVIMVSVLFVAGSAYVYESFSSLESQLQLRAATNEVSTLVSQALRNGSSVATISLPTSTISCSSQTIRLTTSTSTDVLASPLACDFNVTVTGGSHTVQFFTGGSELTIRVA